MHPGGGDGRRDPGRHRPTTSSPTAALSKAPCARCTPRRATSPRRRSSAWPPACWRACASPARWTTAAACRRCATTTACWSRRSPRCASSSATWSDEGQASLGGEDFALMAELVPGFQLRVGSVAAGPRRQAAQLRLPAGRALHRLRRAGAVARGAGAAGVGIKEAPSPLAGEGRGEGSRNLPSPLAGEGRGGGSRNLPPPLWGRAGGEGSRNLPPPLRGRAGERGAVPNFLHDPAPLRHNGLASYPASFMTRTPLPDPPPQGGREQGSSHAALRALAASWRGTATPETETGLLPPGAHRPTHRSARIPGGGPLWTLRHVTFYLRTAPLPSRFSSAVRRPAGAGAGHGGRPGRGSQQLVGDQG